MLAEARKHSLFRTLEKMDEIVNKFKLIADQHLRRGKKNFLTVVEHLRRYSCRAKGVSFCKVQTMAKILEISERTIQRIVKRLEQLGLVQRIFNFDERTGEQLPNFYQLQSHVDWNHVVDCLETKVESRTVTGEVITPTELDDTANVAHNDGQNVTPSILDKPLPHKPFWAIPDKGSFLYSFLSNKKHNEFKEDTYPIGSFPFYNWLMGE